jgi:hypothetical protein
MCADIEATLHELGNKGIDMNMPISDQPLGRIASIALPGAANSPSPHGSIRSLRTADSRRAPKQFTLTVAGLTLPGHAPEFAEISEVRELKCLGTRAQALQASNQLVTATVVGGPARVAIGAAVVASGPAIM